MNYHLRTLEQHGLVELVTERRKGNMTERVLRATAASYVIADRAGKKVATFAIDGEVRFASAADRAAFADELTTAINDLVGKYHDERAPGGRTHRLVVAVHPRVSGPEES